MRAALSTPVLLTGLLLVTACGQGAEEAPPGGERVENAALGLAVAELPETFTVTLNDGERLKLAGPGGGRLDFVNGEVETSINLVQAARDHEASFADRPMGELKQRTEMQSADFGLVYFSRGRYQTEDGGLEEEAVLLLIHPWRDRRLTVRYLYPVTEATTQEELRARFEDELFEVFGELEGMPAPESGGDAPAPGV